MSAGSVMELVDRLMKMVANTAFYFDEPSQAGWAQTPL